MWEWILWSQCQRGNCRANEGEGPLSESLSVCGQHTESETVSG